MERTSKGYPHFVVVEEEREVGREEKRKRKPYIVEPSIGKKLNGKGSRCRVGIPWLGGGQGWDWVGKFGLWGNGEWLGPRSQDG